MLMNSRASTSGDSASAPLGKWITGRPEASRIALAVSVRFSPVTPVEPPMSTASDPASRILRAISPAASELCLSGSMRAMCSVPSSLIISRSLSIMVM